MPISDPSLSPDDLYRLVGTADCPVLIDCRLDEDFDSDPRLLPTAVRRSAFDVADWASVYAGRTVLLYCHKGLKLSQGAAAWLCHYGIEAVVLEGGFVGWQEAGLPLVPIAKLPVRDREGRTVWVTRRRPKIDRIACPWLIRRFVDRDAVFLFVDAGEVEAVATRFEATAFDVENAHLSHRGPYCSFDVMIEEFGLKTEPLLRLAEIIRGADTGRLDLAPEAAGLLAASLGLSHIHRNDLAQLEEGLALYDAFYRWARDGAEETHAWSASTAGDAA